MEFVISKSCFQFHCFANCSRHPNASTQKLRVSVRVCMHNLQSHLFKRLTFACVMLQRTGENIKENEKGSTCVYLNGRHSASQDVVVLRCSKSRAAFRLDALRCLLKCCCQSKRALIKDKSMTKQSYLCLMQFL